MFPPAGPRRLATTRWSVVLAAGDRAGSHACAAMATLCETYWNPVYYFVRGTGASSEEARDLTQAFFARLVEKNDLSGARPDRGPFRAFLLTAVRNFLANQRDWQRAEKRGGGKVHVSLEASRDAGAPDVPGQGDNPEAIYMRRWALAVREDAMERLRRRRERAGRLPQFDRLRPFVAGDDPPSYSALATGLGTSPGALRVAVHRLRQEYGECLRSAIAETVATVEEVDDELRYVLSVLSE